MSDKVDRLILDIIGLKAELDVTKELIAEKEAQLAELFKYDHKRGKTFKSESGFKLQFTPSIRRSIDKAAFEKLSSTYPLAMLPVKEIVKIEYDKEREAYLRANEPETYEEVSRCIVTKQGKTGLKIVGPEA